MIRARYIIREIAAGIAHSCSGCANVILFRGSYHTSVSPRAHMEQSHPAWRNRRRFINKVFFLQYDHCKGAWETDYARALAKVAANEPEAERMTKDNAPKIIKASGGAVVDLLCLFKTPAPAPAPKKDTK